DLASQSDRDGACFAEHRVLSGERRGASLRQRAKANVADPQYTLVDLEANLALGALERGNIAFGPGIEHEVNDPGSTGHEYTIRPANGQRRGVPLPDRQVQRPGRRAVNLVVLHPVALAQKATIAEFDQGVLEVHQAVPERQALPRHRAKRDPRARPGLDPELE